MFASLSIAPLVHAAPVLPETIQMEATAQAEQAGSPAQSAKQAMGGLEIVRESMRRHELYPYVYEEQTLVLTDAHRQRDVRRIRRYSRLEEDGSFRSLLEFTYPESISGTALLFARHADDTQSTRIFLPALGGSMTDYAGAMAGGQMLGSEFSVEDLTPEDSAAFVYRREGDVVDGEVPYFVVHAESRPGEHAEQAFAARRIFLRQDSFFINRIDYLDSAGRLLKRQTRHDLHQVGGEMWRADIIQVENKLNGHRSILKIDRRIYSRDYVPAAMFNETRIIAAASRFIPAADVHSDADAPTAPSPGLQGDGAPASEKQSGVPR